MGRKIFKSTVSVLLAVVIGWGLWQPAALALTDEESLVAEVWRIVNRAYLDRKSTRLNSSHSQQSRMPSSA